LECLRSRGLTDETIFTARLGFVRNVAIPKASEDGTYRASGVVIPWFDGDRLALVKIRQADGIKPRYVEAFRDRPRIYPGPEAIEPRRPLVVAEGEFDAILLNQQIGDHACVMTLGGASSPLDHEIRRLTRGCSPLFIATDADEAGDRAASLWPARAIRVRPPEGCKDWTDVHRSGFSRIRYHWGRHLPMSASRERTDHEGCEIDDESPEDLGCVADETC